MTNTQNVLKKINDLKSKCERCSCTINASGYLELITPQKLKEGVDVKDLPHITQQELKSIPPEIVKQICPY